MKNFKHNISKMILVLGSLMTMAACAPRDGLKEGSTDSASRILNPTASPKAIAYCNERANSDIAAKVKAYQDITGTVRMEYAWLRLESVPAGFQTDGSYISLWKWLAVAGGATHLDKTALNFMLVNPSTNLAITNWRTTLRWSDVKTAAAGMGYSDAASFFKTVKILVDLKDAAGEYDVLRVSNYNVSDNQPAGELDILLPVFHADPADYATEADGSARATVLRNLHPFKAHAGQGYSATQFSTMSKNFCF